jgi:hypothetical protein
VVLREQQLADERQRERQNLLGLLSRDHIEDANMDESVPSSSTAQIKMRSSQWKSLEAVWSVQGTRFQCA